MLCKSVLQKCYAKVQEHFFSSSGGFQEPSKSPPSGQRPPEQILDSHQVLQEPKRGGRGRQIRVILGLFFQSFWSRFEVFLNTFFVAFCLEVFDTFFLLPGTAFEPKIDHTRAGFRRKGAPEKKTTPLILSNLSIDFLSFSVLRGSKM